MPETVPTAMEIAGLLTAAGLLCAAVVARWGRSASAVCGCAAVGIGAGVLTWHGIGRGAWLPLEDNFDALAVLGLLLAGCVIYIQQTRPVGGLDWFVLPIAALLLVGAAIFGTTLPREYRETAWSITHRFSAYGGALALAIAGAVGAAYLLASRRLRNKNMAGATPFANLERLESIAHMALVLGWPLFTVGLVTGIIWGIHLTNRGAAQQQAFFGPKVLLAVGVWVVYALALHSPINPSFRGRKAAVLSLIGLILMAGTLVAVQFMPGVPGGNH